MDGDMDGTSIMAGIYTSHIQLKKSEILHIYTYIYTQSIRGFPVKTGTGSDNTHETSLFVISN